MKIETIYEALLDLYFDSQIDFNLTILSGNTIHGELRVDEPYSVTITVINDREVFVGFTDFVAMNEVQNLIPIIQDLSDATLKAEFATYIRNSKFGITLKEN